MQDMIGLSEDSHHPDIFKGDGYKRILLELRSYQRVVMMLEQPKTRIYFDQQ